LICPVWITDQSDIGDNPQFKQKISLTPGLARLGETRGLASGRRKISIAHPAAAAFAQNELLAVSGQVCQQFTFIGVVFAAFWFVFSQIDLEGSFTAGVSQDRTISRGNL